MTLEAHSIDATFADSLLGSANAADLISDVPRENQRKAVIAFVGMAFEAKIAAGPGILVFSRDARRELANAAANATRHGCRGIISFGVAGGLASDLRPGDCIVASAIHETQGSLTTDTAWTKRLLNAISGARHAPILGVDVPVAEPVEKRRLHRLTGAAAVDMESHVVARLAADHGLAFTAVRVIVDPADRAIPAAALQGMRPDGRTDIKAIMRSLIARPSQISPLVRVAIDAFAARAAMLRVRELLGPHFSFADRALAEAVRSAA